MRTKYYLLMNEADGGEGSGGGGTGSILSQGKQPPAGEPPAEGEGGAKEPPKAASWRDKLPEEIRDNPSLSKFKDPLEVAKAYVNAQKMIGADKLVLPNKNSGDEDWNQVFDKLGRPESPDKYEVSLPENSHIDEEFVKPFQEQAHKLGLLPKQVQGLVEWFSTTDAEAQAKAQTEYKSTLDEKINGLKSEWGAAFDNKLHKVNLAIREFGGEELLSKIEQSDLGNDVDFLKLMAAVGEQTLSEDKLKGGGTGSSMTPNQAKQEYTKIIGDMAHPYHNKSHPGHAEAVKEVQRLMGYAHQSK